jgi:uncharacterized Rmd1/YagE family protein
MENIWSGLVSYRQDRNDELMLTHAIVIILIAAEIAVALANIFVDLYAGVD